MRRPGIIGGKINSKIFNDWLLFEWKTTWSGINAEIFLKVIKGKFFEKALSIVAIAEKLELGFM